MRSSSHLLPDLVVALTGPETLPVEINLVGKVDSVHGGIRTTFEHVPDAPISKFTLNMNGGKKGLIVNSTNICTHKNRAISHFVGQNGKVYDTNPAVKADCKRHKHRSARK